MNLKTYRAATMADALAEVKKDLGRDAVILHTRVYKSGALMGVGGKQVVEITASDQATARPVRAGAKAAVLPEVEFKPAAFAALDVRPAAKPQPAMTPDAPASRVAVRAPLAPVESAAVEALHSELASIRRLVGQVLHCAQRQAAAPVLAAGGVEDHLLALYARMLDAGVSTGIAEQVLTEARDSLRPEERRDEQIARRTILAGLARRMPAVGAVSKAGVPGKPLVIALIGPTGVGKTTTIAKLAAAYKLRQAKRVGLVTCDTYRIAAVEQLRVYANIIGLPLKVALTPVEVGESCRALGDCEVILVDTAGRSQHDTARLEETAAFVDAASPDERHLVLSAGVAESVLLRAGTRFARLSPGRVILTKLDEAVQFGPLVNVLAAVGLPVSYVTTGQEVPDHIELASSDRMSRLVLDGTPGQEWGT